jgi:pimeloyl-ACP methyl ester carboxylesterase
LEHRSVWTRLQVPWAALLGAALLYLLYLGVLFLLQRRMVFPGTSLSAPDVPVAVARRIERLWVDIDGGKVECWFLPPAGQSAPSAAAVFAHGNLELIDLWVELSIPLQDLGVGVLLVEYPGYGRSTGVPTQRTVREAFTRAYDLLVARDDVDPNRIVLIGRSLGGGAVCDLAAHRPSAALILMSTFTSLRSLSRRFLAPGFLVRDPFENLPVVRRYPGPVLVVHGVRDGLIAYGHGVRLAEAAPNGRLITYDADHGDCPPDWPAFWQDVERFLRDSRILTTR